MQANFWGRTMEMHTCTGFLNSMGVLLGHFCDLDQWHIRTRHEKNKVSLGGVASDICKNSIWLIMRVFATSTIGVMPLYTVSSTN
jgi:hypothetical protein